LKDLLGGGGKKPYRFEDWGALHIRTRGCIRDNAGMKRPEARGFKAERRWKMAVRIQDSNPKTNFQRGKTTLLRTIGDRENWEVGSGKRRKQRMEVAIN